jgi:hypothetical protein
LILAAHGFSLFLEDFHPEQKLKLSFELIKVPLNHLFGSNPSSTVFNLSRLSPPRKFNRRFLTIIPIMFSHQSKPYSPSNHMCFGRITSVGNAQTFW